MVWVFRGYALPSNLRIPGDEELVSQCVLEGLRDWAKGAFRYVAATLQT
jgi:hypothetical protein